MTRFGTNSAHVLKSNFCVFEYFFIIFYLRHQKLPPLQKTFSDWMVLSKLEIRKMKKCLFFVQMSQIPLPGWRNLCVAILFVLRFRGGAFQGVIILYITTVSVLFSTDLMRRSRSSEVDFQNRPNRFDKNKSCILIQSKFFVRNPRFRTKNNNIF